MLLDSRPKLKSISQQAHGPLHAAEGLYALRSPQLPATQQKLWDLLETARRNAGVVQHHKASNARPLRMDGSIIIKDGRGKGICSAAHGAASREGLQEERSQGFDDLPISERRPSILYRLSISTQDSTDWSSSPVETSQMGATRSGRQGMRGSARAYATTTMYKYPAYFRS